MLNSPENIANEFTRQQFRGGDFFNMISSYEAITLQEVNQRLQEHIRWEQLAISLVVSP